MEDAILLAQSVATGEEEADAWGLFEALDDAESFAEVADHHATDAAAKALEAAANTLKVCEYSSEHTTPSPDDAAFVSEFAYLASYHAYRAAQASFFEGEPDPDLGSPADVIEAQRADYERLATLARPGPPVLEAAVDFQQLGSLWPNGEPLWFRLLT